MLKRFSKPYFFPLLLLFIFLSITLFFPDSLSAQEQLGWGSLFNNENNDHDGDIPLFLGTIINDTFGIEFEGEWDDGLSFGFGTGILVPQWDLSVLGAYNGYTCRGDSYAERSRADGLEFDFAWYGAKFVTPAGKISLVPGLGLSLLGNLGGHVFQQGWHDLSGVKRAIPPEESSEDTHFIASTNLALFWEIPIVSILSIIPGGEFYIDTQINVTGKVSLSLGRVRPNGTLLLSGYWMGGSYGGDDLYTQAIKDQSGWGIDLRMRMGGLYAISEVDLTTGRPNGTIGIILNPNGFSNNESVSEDSGQLFTIAMTALHQSSILRWAWELEYFFPGINETKANNLIRLRAGMQGGANFKSYYSADLNGVTEDLNYRFLEIYGGVEIDILRNPTAMFSPYIYTDAGYRADMEKSYRPTETTLMSKRSGAFLEVGAGVRFTPNFFILGQAPCRYYIEVETGADIPFYKREAGEPVIFYLGIGVGCRI